MAKIQVRLNRKTGEMTIEGKGFTGEACLLATKKLRDGLGIDAEPDKTSEFYSTEEEQAQQQQGN